MDIQFNNNDPQLSNFSGGAKTTLRKQLEEYADHVVKEANLIEEGLRESDASTEITSSHIIQATRKSRTVRSKNFRTKLVWAKIISSFFTLFTGLSFDLSAFEESPWRFFVFIACLIVTCISTVLLFMWEGGE